MRLSNEKIILELRDVSFHYPNAPIFEHMHMYLEKGEILGIYGDNGCGKSTLLSLISGELSMQQGELYKEDGVIIHHLKQNNRSVAEGSIITVMELLLMHKMKQHTWKGKKAYKKEIVELLERYQMGALQKKQLRVLSGGQLQKVMIVKTLLQAPQVLLLDEPLNALDEQSQQQILEMLQVLKQNQISVILVLHNKALLEKVCDRILICEDRIIREEK